MQHDSTGESYFMCRIWDDILYSTKRRICSFFEFYWVIFDDFTHLVCRIEFRGKRIHSERAYTVEFSDTIDGLGRIVGCKHKK